VNHWTRAFMVAVFLAGGVAAGMGLGRVFDPAPGAVAAAERPQVSGDLSAFQDALASVAEAVSPSVVHLMTEVGNQGDLFQSKGVGSGVVVSADGHIITNHHVVNSEGLAQKLRVRLSDGREYPAKIVGSDSDSDLALIKIEPRGAKLFPIVFADSGKVRVGHLCLAVGSPFGYSNSVTFGTVSGKHRQAALAQRYQDFLQTDAPINPGNSGGALVNIRGELIGINAAIISETRGSDGVGFAIASNLVKWVCDQLSKGDHHVHRGYMGVRPIDFDDPGIEQVREKLLAEVGLKEPRGVFVWSVEPESPADKAGLRKGDVILEFDGRPVAGQNEMFFRVAEVAPGTPVTLKTLREKRERDLKVVMGERPPFDSRIRPR
jgi:serine protease Do